MPIPTKTRACAGLAVNPTTAAQIVVATAVWRIKRIFDIMVRTLPQVCNLIMSDPGRSGYRHYAAAGSAFPRLSRSGFKVRDRVVCRLDLSKPLEVCAQLNPKKPLEVCAQLNPKKPLEVCAQLNLKKACAAWTSDDPFVGQAAQVCLVAGGFQIIGGFARHRVVLRRPRKAGKAALQVLKFVLGHVLEIEQLVAGGSADPDQFVQLQVQRRHVPVLRVLDEKHHQESDNR